MNQRQLKHFDDKVSTRQHVWDRLEASGEAAFPYPPHGRIPNFRGASEAAKRLFEHPWLRNARRIKCNPDAPQRHVRRRALEAGIQVLVPTPRLRGGFRLLDPAQIGAANLKKAVSLSGMERFGETVPVDELPAVDLVVTGCAAATRGGRRCGKGHGYSDLEYAVLRELGHDHVPIVTTVHRLQIVGDFPGNSHDIPLHLIATPDETIEVDSPPPAPEGIDWEALNEADLDAMPVLKKLKGIKK